MKGCDDEEREREIGGTQKIEEREFQSSTESTFGRKGNFGEDHNFLVSKLFIITSILSDDIGSLVRPSITFFEGLGNFGLHDVDIIEIKLLHLFG